MIGGERVLLTGGTGSIGSKLVERLLALADPPESITVFSRDEAKQHHMRLRLRGLSTATDEVIYDNAPERVRFLIGDVRDLRSLERAVSQADIVIHTAAMKQVPTCELHPAEAVRTNVEGAVNIVDAVRRSGTSVHTVIGLSTDKAVKPTSVLGMTKAIQERMFVHANLAVPSSRFVNIRYGNVVASRGSAIPLFVDQIASGGPVTITDKEMTRFFLTMDDACDTILDSVRLALPGETMVPRCAAITIVDLVQHLIALFADGPIPVKLIGVRPGEKVHEVLISDEECYRTSAVGDYLVVAPMLPELSHRRTDPLALTDEYSSRYADMSANELRAMLKCAGIGSSTVDAA